MHVKMKVGVSGNRGDGTEWPPVGGKIEVPDAEGKDLCDAGMAVEVDEPEAKSEDGEAPKVETATVDDESEKAVLTTESGPVKRGPGRPRKDA